METLIILFMAVVVLIVKGYTGYALLRKRTELRKEEAEQEELDRSYDRVEAARASLDRDYNRMDRDRGRYELERNRLESEIRILGGVPVADPGVEEGGEAAPGEALPNTPGAETPGPGEGGFALLVVEDNTELRDVLRSALSRDYHVDSAKDGAEAAALLQKAEYGLVITDLRMPNLNGLELIDTLAADTPFVVISAYLHTDEFRDGLETLKPAAILQKPFKLGQLRSVIEGVRRGSVAANPVSPDPDPGDG